MLPSNYKDKFSTIEMPACGLSNLTGVENEDSDIHMQEQLQKKIVRRYFIPFHWKGKIMTALPMTSLRLFFQDEPNYSDTIPKTIGDIDKEPLAHKERNKTSGLH